MNDDLINKALNNKALVNKALINKNLVANILNKALLCLLLGVVTIPSITIARVTNATEADKNLEAHVDEASHRAMEGFTVPGLAIAVVHKGELVLAKGYGQRQFDQAAKIDDQTLFQIASVSKAFTAAGLALLVDEGKLNWDDHVIDYLPGFRMYDPWVNREFTIRDLLTHRSGLPLGAGDLLFLPPGDTDVGDVIKALGLLKPTTSFRSEYAYDNLLYVVAGELLSRVSGLEYSDFMEQRVLEPLGMEGCYGKTSNARTVKNFATPHVMVEGEIQTTEHDFQDFMAAAGGITCNARGMGQWMKMWLADGKSPSGEQFISAQQFAQLQSPVTLTSTSVLMKENAGSFMSAYALGWGVSTFNGQPLYSHSGAIWGMTSYIAVLPESDVAVFVSNNQMTGAPTAMAMDTLNYYLNADKDWVGILLDMISKRNEAAKLAVEEKASSRQADSMPSLDLTAYTGTYRDAWYGDIVIEMVGGELHFQSLRAPGLAGPLEHFQFNTFIARWTDRQLMADAYVSFTLTPEGGVDSIAMKAVSSTTDFSYDFHDLDLRRVAD